MLLTEIFKSPTKWEKVPATDPTYAFQIGDNHYIVEFFKTVSDTGKYQLSLAHRGSRYDYNWSDSITKTGNAFVVFSTVYNIIENFIQSYRVETIQFDAKEPSRQKLYRRLVKTISNKLNSKYKMRKIKNTDVEHYELILNGELE